MMHIRALRRQESSWMRYRWSER